MAYPREKIQIDDLDGLRLLALGRIPRCGGCPRFEALVDGHDGGDELRGPLPDVPEYCTHQVCAPLVIRYECAEAILHLRAS